MTPVHFDLASLLPDLDPDTEIAFEVPADQPVLAFDPADPPMDLATARRVVIDLEQIVNAMGHARQDGTRLGQELRGSLLTLRQKMHEADLHGMGRRVANTGKLPPQGAPPPAAWRPAVVASPLRETLGPGQGGPDAIRDLQRMLAVAGHPVRETGVYDPETAAAVRAYQAAHRLPVDGVVGLATRQLLNTLIQAG